MWLGKRQSQTRILLLALVVGLAQLASAVDFNQCLVSINNMTIDGKLDNHGRPLPASTNNATAITYNLCVSQCGADQESFQWSVFSQQFNAWLLPWLALISQLPFGANDIAINLASMCLTVGSPTLAAYSLALTALNGRWIARRFWNYRDANVHSAVRVLSSLQQSPLRISDDAGLALLIILPQNDQWWQELGKSLQYTHTWSISSASSIAWVVITYIFTLVDYFTQSADTNHNTSGGSVGTLWLWLLPIAFGWLHLSPKCDSTRLNEAVETANTRAYVANTTNPPIIAVTKRHTIGLDFSTTDDVRLHERITAPIFNYARFLPWVQAVMVVCDKFDNVCDRNLQDEEIAPGITWHYCRPRPGKRRRPEWRLDGSVFSRMLITSALALMLQWGTTGAAIVVVWFTPTIGLGCRSLSYIVYGGASTLVWMMLLTSSILTFYSTDAPARPYPGFLTTLTFRSRVIRRGNTLLIIATSVFQFSGFYDRCYCNSSAFRLGKGAYSVISLMYSDGKSMLTSWISGIVLAIVAAVGFAIRIGLLINSASTLTKKYPRTS
ncbi:hypothetical protein BYT27DRAFT_7220455 [Phlegmacium glaucopus]|nr:hypothetical protein BYT27DRAFT_7220455 [Phlegmacium glaucopus]